jgi:hypothetical protein
MDAVPKVFGSRNWTCFLTWRQIHDYTISLAKVKAIEEGHAVKR